ncbi:NUDIX domain-containing protein [Devosia sp.]|uniref:NUDIX domain-containing protein n=1 Tax=Devosia sp. TaxID=1871048 RepID=UPI003265013C
MDERVRILETQTLSDDWATLNKVTFALQRRDGTWQTMSRESYDRGHAAAMLLLDPATGTVALTRQFRYPVYASGDPAWLIEVCAGLLDGEQPVEAIMREALEETGYRPTAVEHAFDAYMSPGSVTEKLSHFIGHYTSGQRETTGGGLHDEGEDIEVLELPLKQALAMIKTGEIVDAKTIALLYWAALNRPEALK